VRYTLSRQNKQIFASRYKLYLPTEKELVKELKRERLMLESGTKKAKIKSAKKKLIRKRK